MNLRGIMRKMSGKINQNFLYIFWNVQMKFSPIFLTFKSKEFVYTPIVYRVIELHFFREYRKFSQLSHY